MKLVDFRFVGRSEPAPDVGPFMQRAVRVLQMRQKSFSLLGSVVHLKGYLLDEEQQWSEWEDVPFVSPDEE